MPPFEDDPPLGVEPPLADDALLAPPTSDESLVEPPELEEPPSALEDFAPPELRALLPPWLEELELSPPPPVEVPDDSSLPVQAMMNKAGKQRERWRMGILNFGE